MLSLWICCPLKWSTEIECGILALSGTKMPWVESPTPPKLTQYPLSDSGIQLIVPIHHFTLPGSPYWVVGHGRRVENALGRLSPKHARRVDRKTPVA
jgi:hypothetical protein